MEYVDIVDENDEVIGKTTADDAYKNGDIIRIALVFVLNDKNEILLQLRHKNKYHCPLYWTASAGGRVKSKETYLKGAKRELYEELGIKTKLTFIGKEYYEHEQNNKWRLFLTAFTCSHEGPFKIDTKEIEKVEFFSIKDIKEKIKSGEKIQPEILLVLNKYFLN